jgi:hypothetical protein
VITFFALQVLASISVIDLLRTALWNTPLRERKPLACDTCMSGWLAIAQSTALWFARLWRPWSGWATCALWTLALTGAVTLALGWLRNQRSSALPPPL